MRRRNPPLRRPATIKNGTGGMIVGSRPLRSRPHFLACGEHRPVHEIATIPGVEAAANGQRWPVPFFAINPPLVHGMARRYRPRGAGLCGAASKRRAAKFGSLPENAMSSGLSGVSDLGDFNEFNGRRLTGDYR